MVNEVIVCGTGGSHSCADDEMKMDSSEDGCDVNVYIPFYTASHPRGLESSEIIVKYLTLLGALVAKFGAIGCLESSVILCRLTRCISHKT